MRTDAAVIVAGGPRDGAQFVPPRIGPDWPVVAADSGADLAAEVGLRPTLVVGDLDSISPRALQDAERAGVPIERADRDKDRTDLELAIAASRRNVGLRELVVLGGSGGRLDHLLANLAVLCGPATEGLDVEAWLGATRVIVVRRQVQVEVVAGATVSLLAWHGDAVGVTTSGLRWPLDNAVLHAGHAVGTSNVATGSRIAVTLRSGVVSLVVEPAGEVTR
ncbi:MAG: thiamine diphosphokinase [Microthrixaceae bacterium]|nr:thiamine diphosphokinase [Microthrixaceae bacterium]